MAKRVKTIEDRLLENSREAAARLSISERQLWANTQPRGPIPCIRIGGSVRFSIDALRAFIEGEGA